MICPCTQSRVPINALLFMRIPFVVGGRGYDGCDCYGLYRLVLLRCAGIELPLYGQEYETLRETLKISTLIRTELGDDSWSMVVRGSEQPLDLAVASLDGAASWHIGCVVRPGHMLHIERTNGHGPSVEPIWGVKWRDRIIGIYRHRSLSCA